MSTGGTELLNLLEAAHPEAPAHPWRERRCDELGCDQHDLDEPLYVVVLGHSLGGPDQHVLCAEHAFGCCDCGVVPGTIQDLDEHKNWLVCEACFEARAQAAGVAALRRALGCEEARA